MTRSIIIYIIILIILSFQVTAQKGIIRGKVFDGKTGEELIGAAIVIEGTTLGSSTDLDGNYSITNVPTGTVTMQCSYISYQPKVINEIKVIKGQTVLINFKLESSGIQLKEFKVKARAIQKTESAFLYMKKSSTALIDGISSEQISRTGDGNAATALKRVTGLTVEGGKYVYIRGLSDRYSTTTLNGAEIPGLDPNRNTVQMDIFPSNIIENMVVNKTFTPDLPANFTGGNVNIVTRDFPEKYTFQFSNSLGYNPNSNLINNFLSYQGGKYDWLAFDDGSRSIPVLAQGQIPARYENDPLLNKITHSFNKIMEPVEKKSFLNQSHSISFGNQKQLFGKTIGYLTAFSYSRNFQQINDGKSGRFKLIDGADENLSGQLNMDRDMKGTEEVLWAALGNATIKLSDDNKIGLLILHNRSGDVTARFQQGTKSSDEANLIYQTRTLKYMQRSMTTFQLKGEHLLKNLDNSKVEWLSSYTLSKQNEPDLRFFTNTFSQGSGYEIQQSLYPVPTRYYREMNELNFDNKIKVSHPLKVMGATSKLKYGISFVYKDRSFDEKKFFFSENSNSYHGNVTAYLSDSNMDAQNGLYVSNSENSNKNNSYDGIQIIPATFVMVEIPFWLKFKFAGGIRYEYTFNHTQSRKEGIPAGEIRKHDILPSVNIICHVNDKTNWRTAYTRTLARPSFRELAPFASIDFIGDYVFVGNSNLDRTLTDNLDLRWEHYSRPGEIISFSGFYKIFHHPIERTFNTRAANPELTLRNVKQATILGFETEFRKKLDRISPLKNFIFGCNFTVIKSIVSVDEQELNLKHEFDPDFPGTRVMFGQAPYIINSFLTYSNDSIKLYITLSYNTTGERLFLVNAVGIPDVYEQPRHQVDLTINKRFGDRYYLKFIVKNILDDDFLKTYYFKGVSYAYESFTIGRNFSLAFEYKF